MFRFLQTKFDKLRIWKIGFDTICDLNVGISLNNLSDEMSKFWEFLKILLTFSDRYWNLVIFYTNKFENIFDEHLAIFGTK